MGVPAFFRWLCKKYPSIVVNAVEEKAKHDQETNTKCPVDTSQPNPNGVEFDNLYLDMNGIIHPCTHPEDRPPPKNEDEMMVIIFEFIDRIFSIVRPRKLLYMAIDGVAPRAKMNQQRSRRFRAAKESGEKANEIKRLKEQIIANGGVVAPDVPECDRFDSNCITPGTPFMHKLAHCLRYYIHDRLNNDPGWKNIKVILSDANVPGEGEHKIMDYIRRQRANPDHDPNTHHVLCGADADLIMLGLATHEPYFTIIREEFKPDRPRPCEICAQFGHETKECTGLAREKRGKYDELPQFVPSESSYIFLRLSVLREYLARDLCLPNLPFKFELERVIDDWVFMCFFVGNDFLPHLPSLEIREGAIDRLVTLYKELLPKLGGYLTNNGFVDLKNAEQILSGIGQVEDDIFKKRQQQELNFKRRQQEKKKRMRVDNDNMPMAMPAWMKTGPYAPTPLMTIKKTTIDVDSSVGEIKTIETEIEIQPGTKRKHTLFESESPKSVSRQTSVVEEIVEKVEEDNDPVRLWEEGWRQRYYKVKFNVEEDDLDFRYKVAAHYAIGLSWVLRYYYQGVPAWNWYFPYHYAPFASDFVNVGSVKENFDGTTEPFRPFEQLMAVFPAASRKHIPSPLQDLMYNPSSSIIDFYPDDFAIDLNGKKASWQGVALLPFVDEARLKKAIEPLIPKLNPEEKKRNQRGDDYLFVSRSNPLYDYFLEFYNDANTDRYVYENAFDLPTDQSSGIAGKVWADENCKPSTKTYKSPISYLCPDLKNNSVISVKFKDPQFDKTFIFKAEILPGAKIPEATLKAAELEQQQHGSYRPNMGFNYDYNRQNRDSTVANRMLNNAIQAPINSRTPMSSAYGGQTSVYGTYKTSSTSGSNFNNQYQQEYNSNTNSFQSFQQNYNRNNNYNNGPRHQRYQNYNDNGSGGNYNRQNSYSQQQQGGFRQPYNQNYNNQHNEDNNVGLF